MPGKPRQPDNSPPLVGTFREGADITMQEIQDVLADPGYSADQRKEWLKEVLTDLEKQHSRMPSGDRAKLIASIRDIVG